MDPLLWSSFNGSHQFGSLYLLKLDLDPLPRRRIGAFRNYIDFGLSSYNNTVAIILRKAFLPCALVASGIGLLFGWRKNEKPTAKSPEETDSHSMFRRISARLNVITLQNKLNFMDAPDYRRFL